MCDRWKHSYSAFLQDMGERPSEKHSIDRIDNSKGYEPSNCVWAEPIEQNRNRSCSTYVTFQDRTLTLAEWSEELDIKYETLKTRHRRGWSIKRMFNCR